VSRILFRYVLRTYLGLLLGVTAGLLAIFLVADFVDRAKTYTGPNWVADVTVLYGYKALLALQQLGPPALMLAAGAAVSLHRRRGEVTAFGSLSIGTGTLYLPVALAAFLAAGSLIAFDELVVVKAGPRVDEISTQRFNRWGDWRLYFVPKQWFRRNDLVFYLRKGNADRGFTDVTVLRLSPDFRLQDRLDAQQMRSLGGTRWELRNILERVFSQSGGSELRHLDKAEYDFQATRDDFRIRIGRPEQMKLLELKEQIRIRERVGLPSGQFKLALHNRFAYPLAAIPAALLAVGLAMRPSRKGHLTAALVEGLAIAIGLWGMMVVCRTLVMSDRLSPAVAAWAPMAVLVLTSVSYWFHAEGKLRFRRT
jgi:lipopolysaccharide export system permease protein